MPNEIYHRSNWGESKAEGFGDVYYDHAATNKLYNHSDYYENSDGTDATLKDLNNKASIVLTPTAYSDGSLNTVIPPYQLSSELVTNGDFSNGTTDWILDDENNGSISVVDGKLEIVSNGGAGYPVVKQGISTSTGKKYSVSFSVTSNTTGFWFRVDNSQGTLGGFKTFYANDTTSSINFKGEFTAISTTSYLKIFAQSNDAGSFEVDNVSVKEIQEADFDFSRGSSATRVNEQGLVEDVQILSGELVQNGDFEQIGSELVTNGNFDDGLNGWSSHIGSILELEDGRAKVTTANNSGWIKRTDLSIQSGKIYFCTANITNATDPVLFINGTQNYLNPLPLISGNTYGGYITTTGNAPELYIRGNVTNGQVSYIDNVSVKEVGQNWSFYNSSSNTNTRFEDNAAVLDASANQFTRFISSSSPMTIGNLYRVTYEVTETDNTAISIQYPLTYIESSLGVHTVDIVATNTNIGFSKSTVGVVKIDNVSIKEVTNDTDLPRIDFTDGTGSLLLEPQRTNSVPYSNDFSQHVLTGGSITSDDIVSPDGSINADTFVEDTNNSQHKIREDISVTSGTYTMSCFVKGTDRFISFYPQGVSTAYAVFDIANENITASGGSDYVDSQIQSFENDWYRCSLTYNVGTGTSYTHIYLSNSDTNPAPTYTGDGSEMSFYGLQLESGDYPTSYIPTESASVTRSADVANNSGNADLFNDSEGVLYAEVAALADDQTYREIAISDGTSNNRIEIRYTNTSDTLQSVIRSGGTVVMLESTSSYDITNFNKIAVSYKANEFKLYVNSTEVAVDTSGNAPTGLNELAFDDGNGSNDFYGNVKCVAVFKEALSNDLLERLTGEGYESFRLLAEANNYTII